MRMPRKLRRLGDPRPRAAANVLTGVFPPAHVEVVFVRCHAPWAICGFFIRPPLHSPAESIIMGHHYSSEPCHGTRMTDHFDPYHRWLGIPPKHQPADHYRLLGLERFEDDPEVIVDAAERQMAHVRRYALGPSQMLSQTILNELAAAQACLMDPVQKARYDEDLRQRQTAATPRTAPPVSVPAPVIPETPIPPIKRGAHGAQGAETGQAPRRCSPASGSP
jgi:hypothetical protein